MTENEDTGWKDSGHGYMSRSFKVSLPKEGSLEEALKNTWCMSIPDGKGSVTNYGGHWIDGKMVEEWREVIPDVFHNYKEKLAGK